MTQRLKLLYPEWQGCHNPQVHASTLWLAAGISDRNDCLIIDTPEQESIGKIDGVFGLDSIAPRFERALQNLSEANPSHLLMIGGTCGAEAAPIAYLNKRYSGEVAVVWLDAHSDLNTPTSSPSGRFHGMVLRTLLGDGPASYTSKIKRPLIPSQIFLAGVRDLDPPEQVFISAANIPIFSPLDQTSTQRLVEAIATAGFEKIYIHVDVDVLNPASFPDSLMPTPGGPSIQDLEHCILALTNAFDAVGISIVEYCGSSEASRQLLLDLMSNCGIHIE